METSTRTHHQVELSTAAFQQALATYIDDNKPDPLVRRQLEAWKLEGANLESEGGGDSKDDKEEECNTSAFDSSTTNAIHGTLTIQGEYVAVVLRMECSWRHPEEDSKDTKPSDGILTFSCEVESAKMIDKASKENEESKADRKIRKKMVQRLRQDSYIAKLLALNSKDQQSSSLDSILANAKIHVHQAQSVLEERVDVSETVAEAVRRAVFSSADSPLDVIEVILALPSLPGLGHRDNIDKTTPLANRAKLRLLEDAMLDECEKEGEGELIQELSIEGRDGGNESKNEAIEQNRKKKKAKRWIEDGAARYDCLD